MFRTRALQTDLYQLTMAAGYFRHGAHNQRVSFELFVRRLPPTRRFMLTAGLETALAYLGELRGMRKEDIDRRSREVLETVKMTEWADKRIGKFSKGMKQRIAIAQAILHEPAVIILDEPTSGLDPRGMVEVREILMELKKADYTVFMSSHLLNEVQEVCTDVALINRGKLLRSGSVSDLVGQATVRRIEVHVLQKVDGQLLNKVSKLEGITELRTAGDNQFMFSLNGGNEAQSKALTDLQSAGLKVVSFKESGLALETLYMSLIKESR